MDTTVTKCVLNTIGTRAQWGLRDPWTLTVTIGTMGGISTKSTPSFHAPRHHQHPPQGAMGTIANFSTIGTEGAMGAMGTNGTMVFLRTKSQTTSVKNKVPWAPSVGEIDPHSDFTAEDFYDQAIFYIEKIISRGYVPIIVGGSNSYIENLVENPTFMFKSKYDSCFIWIDVDVSALEPFLHKRVDHMVQAGLVDEVREIFSPEADYSKGIRRSIGVPEMDKYFREENKFDACEESMKKMLLESAVKEIKVNTCNLVRRQHEKIKRFRNEKMWPLHYIDATNVFKENEKEGADDKWKHDVLKPCLDIVKEFLK
ncbi:putative serine/threonine-protein kinase Nek6-like [Capsicum annuum]|nr:putative serine/threonine-protein kinase Nek6-like [Capsicum annuum]